MTQIWIVFRIYQLKRNTTSLIGCFTEELDALKVACKHCDESEYINTCLNLLKDATNTYNHHDKNSTDVEEWRKIFKNCHFNFDTCFDLRSERGLDRISTSIKIVQCPLNSVNDICISEF